MRKETDARDLSVADCAKSGVVYQEECLKRHAYYVGETDRLLSISMKQQLSGIRRGKLDDTLGKHKAEANNGNDFNVRCVILARESDISARKALEAAFICTKNPVI